MMRVEWQHLIRTVVDRLSESRPAASAQYFEESIPEHGVVIRAADCGRNAFLVTLSLVGQDNRVRRCADDQLDMDKSLKSGSETPKEELGIDFKKLRAVLSSGRGKQGHLGI
jgi:hypothetical protein